METPPVARGKALETAPDTWGDLRSSADLITPDATGDIPLDAETGAALRARMTRDGYLFLPGLLDRNAVEEARREIVTRLASAGGLAPHTDPMEAVASPNEAAQYFRPDLAGNNAPLRQILYAGRMTAFFGCLFGETAQAIRPFDFTWLRAVSPGGGAAPHCDIVYMGRGTHDLFTAWTPLGDIDLKTGGLIVLEHSHQKRALLGNYTHQDVDSYCENGPNKEAVLSGKMHWENNETGAAWDGAIGHDLAGLRQKLGGRWLSCPHYQMGDVLVFTPFTVHASLDNQSDRLRLSSDTRYQRASDPIDERWINGPNGEKPQEHGLSVKRGRIC